MPRFNMNWIYILVIAALAFFYFTNDNNGLQSVGSAQKETSYDEFKARVDSGYASKIVINKDTRALKMYVKPEYIREVFNRTPQEVGNEPYLFVEIGSIENVEKFLEDARKAERFTGPLSYEHEEGSGFFGNLIGMLLPIFFFVAIWMFFIRRMGGGGVGGGSGIFSVGKSKAKMYEKGGDLGITFKDVAGQAGAKQEIQEIVEFLKNPQ